MPRYRVYVTESGLSTRAISIDYVADDEDDAEKQYMDWAPFDDYSVDDEDFEVHDRRVDQVQLLD